MGDQAQAGGLPCTPVNSHAHKARIRCLDSGLEDQGRFAPGLYRPGLGVDDRTGLRLRRGGSLFLALACAVILPLYVFYLFS